jgi:hypothetical protein
LNGRNNYFLRLFTYLTGGEIILTENKTLHDNMLKGNQLILINSEDTTEKNPVYRVLVQTPGILPYYDLGINVDYKEEGIKDAIKTLIGHNVREAPGIHEQKLGIVPPDFGTVVNADYCPDYGGYADIEIFNQSYKPVFENMNQRLIKGEPVKNKFSTEVTPITMELKDKEENLYDLNKWVYDGLVMTKSPRDQKTGLCSVLANSEDFKGDDIMSDEIKLTKEEYDNLQQAKIDLAALQDKYNVGKELYENMKPEDFKEYQELLTEKNDLHAQLVPVWTADGKQKLELVNSLVEALPEDKQEAAKARFEKMELEDLKLVNSFRTGEPPEPAPGVTGRAAGAKPHKSSKDKDELTEEEYMKGLGLA